MTDPASQEHIEESSDRSRHLPFFFFPRGKKALVGALAAYCLLVVSTYRGLGDLGTDLHVAMCELGPTVN